MYGRTRKGSEVTLFELSKMEALTAWYYANNMTTTKQLFHLGHPSTIATRLARARYKLQLATRDELYAYMLENYQVVNNRLVKKVS